MNLVDLHDASVSQWEHLASAMDICLTEGRTTPERALSLVRECESSSLDHSDLLALSKMRAHMEGDTGQEVESILRPLVVSYWEETIEDDIRENGLLTDLYGDDDTLEGERRVENAVEEILAEYGLHFDAEDFDIIAGHVDVALAVQNPTENELTAARNTAAKEKVIRGPPLTPSMIFSILTDRWVARVQNSRYERC